MRKFFRFKSIYKRNLVVAIISFSFIIALITSAGVYAFNQIRLQEILIEKNRNMQEQLANIVDALFAEVDMISIQYSLNRTVNDYVFRDIKSSEDYTKVRELIADISSLKTTNPLINSVDILYPHKKFVISNSTYWMDELRELKQPDLTFYESLLESESNYVIEKRQKYIGASSIYKTVISVSRYFKRGMYGGVIIIVNIDMDGLINTIKQVSQNIDMEYFVLKDNNVLFANESGTESFLTESGYNNDGWIVHNQNNKITYNGESYFIMTSLMKYGNLSYGLIVPAKNITSISNPFDLKILRLFFGILLFCVFIGWAISNILYMPVNRLIYEISSDKPGCNAEGVGNADIYAQKTIDDFGFIRNRFSAILSRKDDIEAILSKNMPLIKRNFLLNLVKGKLKKDEAYEKCDLYGIKLYKKYFTVVILKIEHDISNTGLDAEGIASLTGYKLEEELEKQKDSLYEYSLFEIEDDKICLILNYDDKENFSKNTIFKLCRRIQKAIADFYMIEMTITTGATVESIENLGKSYQTAQYLDAQILLYEKGHILLFENSITEKPDEIITENQDIPESIFYPLEEANEIVLAVKNCDKKSVNVSLESLKHKINSSLKQNDLQFILPQLVSGVIHAIIESEALSRKVMDEAHHLIQSKKELLIPTNTIYLDKYFNDLEDLFANFIEYKQNRIMEKNAELVDKVIEYIDDRFTENISLENIADYLCISSGHLSRIFKFSKGITVIDYMTGKKLQYSMELLQNSGDQIQVISKKVGYNCSRTFIRAFKIEYGITPGQARERAKAQNLAIDKS